jgi:hypothetical protein
MTAKKNSGKPELPLLEFNAKKITFIRTAEKLPL